MVIVVINVMVMFSIYVFICKEEPDDVNNFQKNFAHILKFGSFIVYITGCLNTIFYHSLVANNLNVPVLSNLIEPAKAM